MVRYSLISSSLLIIIFLLGLGGTALAEQQQSVLLQKLQEKIANPKQRRMAIFAGKDRALICGYCHGNDGNSIKPEVPNLAGQNPDYLLQQISHFASGERKDFVMNSLARKFTADDQINLAIFYASQTVKLVQVDQAKAEQGKTLYQQQCQACHGSLGRGKTGYARLAGQKPAYIKMTLESFRDNLQGKPATKKRRSSIMEPVASRLTDTEIQYLAAYIASL